MFLLIAPVLSDQPEDRQRCNGQDHGRRREEHDHFQGSDGGFHGFWFLVSGFWSLVFDALVLVLGFILRILSFIHPEFHEIKLLPCPVRYLADFH
jgi:hypothetical protein